MVRIARPVRRTSAEIQATQTVGAVHLGRLIFTNLRRALVYVTAIHVPIAGLALLAAVLGLYLACLPSAGEAEARGVAYAALAVGNLALAVATGPRQGAGLFAPHRRLLWGICSALAAILLTALYIPVVSGVFQFAAPSPFLLSLGVVVGLGAGGWSGLVRSVVRRRLRSDP